MLVVEQPEAESWRGPGRDSALQQIQAGGLHPRAGEGELGSEETSVAGRRENTGSVPGQLQSQPSTNIAAKFYPRAWCGRQLCWYGLVHLPSPRVGQRRPSSRKELIRLSWATLQEHRL